MRPPFDGWVDKGAARVANDGATRPPRGEVEVRRSIATFRGEVLSAAYAFEGSLDTVIVWHLFRNRQDGMAAFFEDSVLRDNSFGLGRKIRMAGAIIDYWADEKDQGQSDKALFEAVRNYRNRIAHWPTRLVPLLEHRGGGAVDFEVELVKDGQVEVLDELNQARWLNEISQAQQRLDALSKDLAEFSNHVMDE